MRIGDSIFLALEIPLHRKSIPALYHFSVRIGNNVFELHKIDFN